MRITRRLARVRTGMRAVIRLCVVIPVRGSIWAVRECYQTVRAGRIFWMLLQPVRLFRFLPFTLLDSSYYWYCRLRSLQRAESYSSAVFYTTEHSKTAVRNFILDMDRRNHDGRDFKGEGQFEVIVAGRIQPGRIFSVATLFPRVKDVHFYMDQGQVSADLPYFLSRLIHGSDRKARHFVDLDHYPTEHLCRRFAAGNPIVLPALTKGNSSLHVIYSLLRKRKIVVLNLPTPNGNCEQMLAQWAEFFELVKSLKQPHAFLLLGVAYSMRPLEFENDATTHSFFTAGELGLDILDCFWVIRECGAYVGALDEFGLMTIGTRVPAILLDPDKVAVSSLHHNAPAVFLDSGAGQRLSLDALTPRQVFEEFNRVYDFQLQKV
jgi:hypothetical protein